jgi:hypothetical protein
MECRRDDDGLFRLDVGRPDHLGPLLGLVGDELTELGRRARKRGRSEIGNSRLDLGIGEPRIYFFVQFVDYLCGRALRRTCVDGAALARTF